MVNGWTTSSLGAVSSLITSGSRGWAEYYSQDGNPFIRMTNLPREGIRLDLSDLRYVRLPSSSAEGQRTKIQKRDVLISITAELGKIGFVSCTPDCDAYVNQHVCLVRLGSRDLDAEFLAHFLSAANQRARFNRLNDAGAKAGLNLNVVSKFRISFPPMKEQIKIAEILRTWDEAIEDLEELKAANENLTSGIADDLIFGVCRIAGYQEPWSLRRLAEVTRELTRRNSDGAIGRDLVMGVTNSRGIVPMRDQTIAADISRYLILPPRAFAYNPMRINVGSIAMSRFDHDVLVSPDYVLFECVPGQLDPDFLGHLRRSHFWSHHINAGGTGSVRMRTYYEDLAALRLKIPPYDEQLAISEVLNTANRVVSLVGEQIEALKRQKRGLMQKLLTGEWRVKI